MNREFLKGLGLDDDAIEKVMTEHGKSIKANKASSEELENLRQEKTNLEQTLNALTNERDGITSKYSELENAKNELESNLQSLKIQELKRNIALQNNIPLDLADRLTGEDEASLKADAEKLSAFVASQNVVPLKTDEPQIDEDYAYRNLAKAFTKEN